MKDLHRLCGVVVFTLVLTTTAFAGDIHTGSPALAPPEQSSVTESIQITFAMENPQGTCESVAGVALSLLQTMLSVF